MKDIKTLPQRALELSLGALLVAIILTWAWTLLEPLVPVIACVGAVVVVVAAVGRWFLNRRHAW